MGEIYDFYTVLTWIKSYSLAYLCINRTEMANIQSRLWFLACFMDSFYDRMA